MGNIDTHLKVFKSYLAARKNEEAIDLLEQIYSFYTRALEKIDKGAIGSDAKRDYLDNIRAVKHTEAFINIIDFIYVQNFRNPKFFSLLNHRPRIVATAVYYIVANRREIFTRLDYVAIYKLFGIREQNVRRVVNKICELCGIEYMKDERNFSLGEKFR